MGWAEETEMKQVARMSAAEIAAQFDDDKQQAAKL